MKRRILNYGLWFILTVSPALGSPLISIQDQYMLNTDAQRLIPILVSSSTHELVEGVNLAVQIGDGGSVNGGTNTAPQITNLDIIGSGTIFNASNTGSTPSYPSGNAPYLLVEADTTTVIGTSVEANGVLAYLTVNSTGAALGSYQISLQNVGEHVQNTPPLVWTTDFVDVSASFPPSAVYIHIVSLHETKWNAGANGAWTDSTWTSSAPPYPNYTCQAIVDTSYTVSVASAQEADSLAISGGGKVAIGSSGGLTVTNNVTVSTGGTLAVASGAALSAAGIQLDGGTLSGTGTITPAVSLNGGTLNTPNLSDNMVLSAAVTGTGGLTKTGSGTVTLSGNATYAGDTAIAAGRLQLNGLSSTLHSVTGAGTLGVGNGITSSTVTADSIQVDTLSIGAGSTFAINAVSGGDSLASVPEPSTIVLLIAAALGILSYLGVKRGQNYF
ncbi:MAG: autotransporter-associated beta strand repeat-containing protein [Thermoguttaceae bacterium]|jgi:autotransporter-associated beta strand protein